MKVYFIRYKLEFVIQLSLWQIWMPKIDTPHWKSCGKGQHARNDSSGSNDCYFAFREKVFFFFFGWKKISWLIFCFACYFGTLYQAVLCCTFCLNTNIENHFYCVLINVKFGWFHIQLCLHNLHRLSNIFLELCQYKSVIRHVWVYEESVSVKLGNLFSSVTSMGIEPMSSRICVTKGKMLFLKTWMIMKSVRNKTSYKTTVIVLRF